MTKVDYERFVNCLLGCAEIAEKNLSKQAILLYWNTLKHLEIDVVVNAFNRHLVNPDNGQYMPKPADIIRLCKGSNLDSAMIAWSMVLESIKLIGRYDSVVFDDRATMVAIKEMGGWIALCKMADDEIPFRAQEFQNRYKSYKTMGRSDTPNKLIGVYEATNSTNGKYVADPVLIGNKAEARKILAGCEQERLGVASQAMKLVKH